MPKQNTAVLVHIVCVLMTGVTSYIFAIIYNICIYAYIYMTWIILVLIKPSWNQIILDILPDQIRPLQTIFNYKKNILILTIFTILTDQMNYQDDNCRIRIDYFVLFSIFSYWASISVPCCSILTKIWGWFNFRWSETGTVSETIEFRRWQPLHQRVPLVALVDLFVIIYKNGNQDCVAFIPSSTNLYAFATHFHLDWYFNMVADNHLVQSVVVNLKN